MSLAFLGIFLVLFLSFFRSLNGAEPAKASSKKATSLNPAAVTHSKNLRIVGGKEAIPHSYPSIVIMNHNDNPVCSGTILSSEWILSAAHCAILKDPSEYSFLAGKHDKSKKEASGQKRTCIQVVVHEDYVFGEEYDQKNDIAMFRVYPSFDYNDKVKTVKLPPRDWDKTGPAIPVGWGKIGQEDDETSNKLLETSVPVISNKECATMMPDIFDTSLCASSDGGRDACAGDSGGPLYFKEGLNAIQIGIVSWGDGCGKTGKAGVYTRVTKYLDWIHGNFLRSERIKYPARIIKGRGLQMTPVNDTAAPVGRGVLKAPAADKGKDSRILMPVINKEARIVGGTETKPNEYPSVVLMNIYDQPACAGTIYNSEWVISAGHCVISLDPSDFTFYAGKHDKFKEEETQQKRKCVQVVRHEGFDAQSLINDIALFKVSPPFQRDDKIFDVELAPKNWNKQGNAIAVGWGRLAENGSTASRLQQVQLPLIPNDECSKIMADVYNTSICAGSLGGGKDACQGDSGGPLFYKEKRNIIQIGIVSWGVGCARQGNAGIYTRISKYLSWIKSHTSPKAKSGRVKTAIIFNGRPNDDRSGAAALTNAQVEDAVRSFPRSVGGVEARKHQFPSIVLIVYNGRVVCSGTIIHSKWVLSAAHCVLGTSPSSFVILAGKHQKYTDEDMEQNVTAIQIVKHAAYSNNLFNNDITLFKVKPPFKLNKYVKPAKLPKPDMQPEGMSMAAGWGASTLGDDSSDNLQRARLPIITNEKCQENYGKNQIFPGNICAGYKKGKAPCHGDSGGPLYFLAGHSQTVIGVMSWVKGSGKAHGPGVYTRVTEYLPWIDEHTGLKSSKPRSH